MRSLSCSFTSCSTTLPTGLLRCLGLLFMLACLIMPAQGKAAEAAPAGISAKQAQDVLAVLNDPKKREELTRTLSVIAKTLPAKGAVSQAAPAKGAPASAAPAPKDGAKPAAAGAEGAAADADDNDNIIMQEIDTIKVKTAEKTSSFLALFKDMAFVGSWFHTVFTTQKYWDIVSDAFMRAGLIFLVALVIERVVSLALRMPLRKVALKAHDDEKQHDAVLRSEDRARREETSDTEPSENAEMLSKEITRQRRLFRAFRRVPFALAHFLIKLIPVAAVVLTGLLGAAFFSTSPQSQHVIRILANSYAIARVTYLLVEAIFVPNLPSTRLCSASDRTARIVTNWWAVLVAAPSLTICLIALGSILHMPARGTMAMLRAVVLAEHILIGLFIWRIRKQVGQALQPPSHMRDKAFWSAVGHVARQWWVPALFLDAALWFVWATQQRDGYEWILRTTLMTVAVIITFRLLHVLCNYLLNRCIRMPKQVQENYPGLQERLDGYYPHAHRIISILLLSGAFVCLLQAWNLHAVAFLTENPFGSRLLNTVITLLVALVMGVAIWETCNILFQKKILYLENSGYADRAVRLRTLFPILQTVLFAVLCIVIILTSLSQIGINIGPLLAGAGILGVAISFGSQKLVQDFITGFFLLVENAMQVGDYVTAAGISGTVEHLSIRTLRLRALDGSLQIIPFSSVGSVVNMSKDFSIAIVKFSIDVSEDVERVHAIMADVVEEMRKDQSISYAILSELLFMGVSSIENRSVNLLANIRCLRGQGAPMLREFNRRMSQRIEQDKIRVPLSVQTLNMEGPLPVTGSTSQEITHDAD